MIETNKELWLKIRSLKEEHPAWGDRRVWAYFKYRRGLPINKKRVYRLMKQHGLLVPKYQKLRAKREAKTSKSKTQSPDKIWGWI